MNVEYRYYYNSTISVINIYIEDISINNKAKMSLLFLM